jgi:preprotein translocase subunit SecA
MIGKTLSKIFGTRNERELKRLDPIVAQVTELSETMSPLSDEELVGKTAELKARHAEGETLDELMPEAFAVVREAAWRVLKMRHFDCQIVGGIVLHEGKIAEMKTGEGKTLMATLPVYLNALTGRGVHVVTVNDYLARRDSEWMGAIYRFLGLSVGVILHGLDDVERRDAYACDIVYGTNNEFGFDYLRDNMKFRLEEYVQRDFYYAIVDEVDSILIDEARTPLIISGASEESTEKYYVIDKIIPKLVRSTQVEEAKGEEPADGDFTVDEKSKTTTLTERGVEKVEKLLKIDNLFDPRNIEILHHVNQGLRAHIMFKRDIDYVVNEGEVVIVDEFTGRLMPGRRWSDGLHQAVEAKEGVRIASESQTYASVTFQNYFRMYEKLGGMTGTADTEAAEFQQTYGLDVMVIPTNKPMLRADNADVIYRTVLEKREAVLEEVQALHEKGQPVLVGTITIEDSERFSRMLKRKGVKHHVLNAKHHDREAEIVAQAGRFGAVMISTNMAGRGTDIMLGGNPVFMARDEVDPVAEPARYEERLAHFEKQCAAEREKVLEAGGLHILGTERHESRRIDNQLRGRSGRQGDPGSSRFFLSLEDDLMRIFGSERISGLLSKLGLKDGEDIQHPWISKAIENAQSKVEGHNFDIRKHLLEYDDVMNRQRESIYGWRREVLGAESLVEEVKEIAEGLAIDIVEERCPTSEAVDKWDLSGLREAIFKQFQIQLMASDDELRDKKDELAGYVADIALERYDRRLEEFGQDAQSLQRYILLHNIDSHWKDHLLSLDHLKSGVGLRGYAQENPLVVYKQEGYQLFVEMRHRVEELTIEQLYRVKPAENQAVPQEIEKPTKETQVVLSHGTSGENEDKTVKKSGPAIGRNDPCTCGSGKKYKKCCGRGI